MGLGVMLLMLTQCNAEPATPTSVETRPDGTPLHIQLLTSLPLIWGEGASVQDILSGKAEPAAIYRYWQQHYKIEPVDSLENLASTQPDILILAQPRAMAPADLADLDLWLRQGGRVIIFTDPMLIWPSDLPLGDPRRPLAIGLLSPLLKHWGIEMFVDADQKVEPMKMAVENIDVNIVGPGFFALRDKDANATDDANADSKCQLTNDSFTADCKIGRGRAILVADADLLDADLWDEAQSDLAQDNDAKSGAIRLVDWLISRIEQ